MSSLPTRVYVYYTPSALWCGFRCEGTPGDKLEAQFTQRDDKVWRDDSVDLILNHAGDPEKSAHISVNCAAVVYDALGGDASWNPELVVQTTRDGDGWSAVIGVPFRALGVAVPKDGDAWAVNFCRSTSGRQLSCWAPVLKSYVEPERYGRLVFGGRRTSAAQMHELDPVNIGRNRPTIVCPAGSTFRITGYDIRYRPVLEEHGPIGAGGRFEFVLIEDRVRSVSLAVADDAGTELLRGFYPMHSPQVSERARTIAARFAEATRMLAKFRAEARAKAEPILAKARPLVEEATKPASEPEACSTEDWQRLASTVGDLTMQLDGVTCHARMLAKMPEAEFAVGLESSMRKVMIKDHPFEGVFDDHYELALARNEHEGFQVVVIPFGRDLADVTVSVGPLKSAMGQAFNGRIEVSLVGHVDVADNPPYDAEHKGWWPDPLLSFLQKSDVKEGEHVAFWIDVATRVETQAGSYEGTLTITARDASPIGLRLKVQVWDFALPNGTHLRNAFTYNEGPTGNFYKGRWNDEMRYRYYDFILDHRLNIDHLYRQESPEIGLLKYGAGRGMNAFNVGGVFRQGKGDKDDPKLSQYVQELKNAGVFDRAYVYGFDEAKREKFTEIREVFGEIRKRFPGLKTMTTAVDRSFGKRSGLREVVDIWVPLTDSYDIEAARELRREGREMWWYICVVPTHPYANWFIEYPAIEARLLTGVMSYKYEVGGFLYYLINLWEGNSRPISKGPYTDWNPGSLVNEEKKYTANGDGSLLCPGPDGPLSTIRLENIRDGFEDYEYLWLLRETLERIGKRPPAPAHRAFLDRAAALLRVPDSVVTTTTNYTRDPQEVIEFRARLAEAILEGQSLLR
ncbi:MAG TPA: DUF4091 domain-containing protein [Phycisphaerae bacterium]|nr:DUF4091 domain-containing protein [Phycisphaerae bacterium]